MRGWHESPNAILTVKEILGDFHSRVIVFTNGQWVGVDGAIGEGWEVEVAADD